MISDEQLIVLSEEVRFDRMNSSLLIGDTDTQSRTALDNLEFIVLDYFIAHAGEVIAKEQLLSLWPTSLVMDHSLARVISSLRKKLGDSSKNPIFIKTIQRQGYAYVGSIGLERAPTNLPHQGGKLSIYTLVALVFITLSLMLWYLMLPESEQQTAIVKYQVQVIPDKHSQKQDLSIHPEGQYLAYSAKPLGQNYWFLRIKHNATNEVFDHSDESSNIFSPVWVSAETLVYQSWSITRCDYIKIAFSIDKGFHNKEQIASCKPDLSSQALARLDHDKVLVSAIESIGDSSRSMIYVLNVKSGQKTLVKSFNGFKGKVYQLSSSPSGNSVAVLQSNNWSDTFITIFNTSNFDQELWSKQIAQPLYSVALNDQTISYLNELGNLATENFTTQQAWIENIVFTSKVYHPIAYDHQFWLFEGPLSHNKVNLKDIGTGLMTEFPWLSNTSASIVKILDNEKFIFVSEQSGQNQVWLYDMETKNERPLTTFEQNYTINDLAYDDLNMLAIESEYGVSLFAKTEKGEYQEVQMIPNAQFPIIAGNTLYYTQMNERTSNIYRYELGQSKPSLFIRNGYRMSIEQNRIYYAKYFEPGLWQYRAGGDDELHSTAKDTVLMETWYVNNGKLYLLDDLAVIIFDLSSDAKEIWALEDCANTPLWRESYCFVHQNMPVANRIIKVTINK